MHASLTSIYRTEPDVELLFYAADDRIAQRLSAKLRGMARVQWESSRLVAPLQLAPRAETLPMLLLDYSPGRVEDASALASELTPLLPHTLLVGVGSPQLDQAAGVLAALRDGVRDFIDLDAPTADIQRLLQRLKTQAGAAPRAPTLAPVAQHRGQLILLIGARAGVGTSTLAAHLGALAMPAAKPADPAATADPQRRVLLLDLGRPAGDANLYLNVEGKFCYEDALQQANRLDATLVRTALAHHRSRLTLLSQPAGTVEAPTAGSALDVMIERLSRVFDAALCDLGGLPFAQIPPALLRAAGEIWLVADQSIGAMMSLDTCLRELDRAGVRDQRLSLVVTRQDDDCGISPAQIAERFKLPLLAALPDRSRALRAAANQGQLLHESAPNDPYIRALGPLLARLHAPAAAGSPLWKRLLSLKGGFTWPKT